MPKVVFKLGEFRRFAHELPADMPAIAALNAFLIARGSIKRPVKAARITVRGTKKVKKS